MNDCCKKCNKVKEGKWYTFHHGKKGLEENTNYQVDVDKISYTKRTHYSDIQAVTYFLCNSCVRKKIITQFLLGLFGSSALILSVFYIFYGELWSPSGNWIALACLTPSITFVLALFLLIHGFEALKRQTTAEKLAISLGKKEIRGSDKFFTGEEYQKLKPEDMAPTNNYSNPFLHR